MEAAIISGNPAIAPKTLNGCPVTMASIHANRVVTVLVTRADDPMPYVVATWWEELGNGWMWGYYSDDPEQAMTEFLEKAKRDKLR